MARAGRGVGRGFRGSLGGFRGFRGRGFGGRGFFGLGGYAAGLAGFGGYGAGFDSFGGYGGGAVVAQRYLIPGTAVVLNSAVTELTEVQVQALVAIPVVQRTAIVTSVYGAAAAPAILGQCGGY